MAVDLEVGTGRTGGRDATTGVIPGKYALSVGCPDIEPPRRWKWTALSSVAQLESGHTPSRKHPEYWDGDIPWIGIKDATENHGRTIHDTYQHVSELGLQNSSARLLPANTVCLSRTASVGFVVVMGRPMATSQDFVNWVCGPEIDPHFLKYVLLLENEALWRFARGTTHQTIYYPEAKAFHVCLPPLPEQKAIARILGTLDDKIELNRRMNATLEAMARALFQSWFVDFDPVRRNAARAQNQPSTRPKGHPSHSGRRAGDAGDEDIPPLTLGEGWGEGLVNLDKLFPDSFQDSELGEIPEGWAIQPISSLCTTITSGGTPSRKNAEYWSPAEIPWFKTGELLDGPLIDSEELISTAGLENSSCKLWPADTVLFALYASPTVGRLGVLSKAGTANQAAAALIAKKEYGTQFLVGSLLEARAELQRVAVGAAQQNINQGVLKNHEIVTPPPALAKAYSDRATPLFEMRVKLAVQSRTLATLRDTLLPKLLNGNITPTNSSP